MAFPASVCISFIATSRIFIYRRISCCAYAQRFKQPRFDHESAANVASPDGDGTCIARQQYRTQCRRDSRDVAKTREPPMQHGDTHASTVRSHITHKGPFAAATSAIPGLNAPFRLWGGV